MVDWQLVGCLIAATASIIGVIITLLVSLKKSVHKDIQLLRDDFKKVEKRIDKLEDRFYMIEERIFFLAMGKTLEEAILAQRIKNP